jgi:hypothetical protein
VELEVVGVVVDDKLPMLPLSVGPLDELVSEGPDSFVESVGSVNVVSVSASAPSVSEPVVVSVSVSMDSGFDSVSLFSVSEPALVSLLSVSASVFVVPTSSCESPELESSDVSEPEDVSLESEDESPFESFDELSEESADDELPESDDEESPDEAEELVESPSSA